MVAQHTKTPDEPPRPLSAAVAEELEQAVRAFLSQPSGDADEALRRAIASAGRDARERQLRPEELLLAFKSIEERVRAASSKGHASARTRLIQALLEAYYDR